MRSPPSHKPVLGSRLTFAVPEAYQQFTCWHAEAFPDMGDHHRDQMRTGVTPDQTIRAGTWNWGILHRQEGRWGHEHKTRIREAR